MTPEHTVLIIDDEEDELRSVARTLRAGGITNVTCVQDSRDVKGLLEGENIAVLLLDLAMPHVSGQELLSHSLEHYPQIPVIVFTGFNEVETAVHCMRAGAFDYMVKPVEKSRMLSGVRRALEISELRLENVLLRQRMMSEDLEHPEAFGEIVTNHPLMKTVFRYVETVSKTAKPVTITGETGTGKELVARAIHALSGLKGEFVPVNVAGLDGSMFADTLFGHTRGAFTGADTARGGLIERAEGGTLFLDEIGELSLPSQVKLLRLLQEKEYFPLGADLPKRSNARVLLATNRNLDAMQSNGDFRRDLYYRIQTHHVEIPPLRERLSDLPLLVDHLMEKAADSLGKKKPTPPKELYDLLSSYHWPGNIRELEALVFDAVSHHTSRVLSLDIFRSHIEKHGPQKEECASPFIEQIAFPQNFPSLKEVRRMQIEEAMRRANENQAIAARMLGITRTALNKWLKRNA